MQRTAVLLLLLAPTGRHYQKGFYQMANNSYTPQQVQAVHNYNTAANAAHIAAQPGRGGAQLTRAAIAAGKVPGVGAHNANNAAVVKALGRQVRQVGRTHNPAAAPGRGGTWPTATTKGNNALGVANSNAAKAAKAKAKAAKAAPATAKANA